MKRATKEPVIFPIRGKGTVRSILWIIAAVVSFLWAIRYIESKSIYYPMKEITANPAAIGLSYEEVYFDTSDGKRLNGWHVVNDKAGPTLILCHGNAGNISHRLEKISIFHNLGLNVFAFDYRGYGKSRGMPSERGFYRDLNAAYNYLTCEKKIPGDDIILYGESIGGAVAIDLARRTKVKALITEETFTSIRDMAKTAFPALPYFIFSSRFDAISKIRDVSCPKLIIHSIDDEIVPFAMGKKMFEMARPPKTFLEIRGSHNTAFLESQKQFTEGIKIFLDDYAAFRNAG